MKNYTLKNSQKSNLKILVLFLTISLFPTNLFSQNYRTIQAYMDDFAKNELFVKNHLWIILYLLLNHKCIQELKLQQQEL